MTSIDFGFSIMKSRQGRIPQLAGSISHMRLRIFTGTGSRHERISTQDAAISNPEQELRFQMLDKHLNSIAATSSLIRPLSRPTADADMPSA